MVIFDKKTNSKTGFTIIELMISIVIISIIATITLSAFNNTNKRKSLETTVELIQSSIDDAKSRSILGADDNSHGIRFDSNSVTIFVGDSYSAVDPMNNVITFENKAEISDISISGGGSEVYFERLTGETDQTGTIRISLIEDPMASTTLSITKTGFVDVLD